MSPVSSDTAHLLQGRVAIVTGSASGIGQQIAVAYAQSGASVVVADIADGAQTVEMIRGSGGKAQAIVCDISLEADTAKLIAFAESAFGGLDILVNNAGIFPFAPVEATPLELWNRVFAVNATGTFLTSKAALPALRRRGGGKIINVSSGTFFVGIPAAGAYVASKGAVIGFSRVLAREVGAENIQVNVITPGLIRTQGVIDAGMTEEFFGMFRAQQSIPRTGAPDDLAGAALFLASSLSNFITGQIVNVDGGLVAH